MADNLLKEAIAEARQVRDAAIANAKMALEEAFTPRLASALSAKLRNEMADSPESDGYNDGEDKKAVEEEVNPSSSDVGASDNKEPSAGGRTSSNVPNPGQELASMGENPQGVDHKIGGSRKAPDNETDAHPENLHEDDLGLDVEDDEEEDTVDLDPTAGAEGGDEFGGEDEFGGGEEDTMGLDLEDIIRELEALLQQQQGGGEFGGEEEAAPAFGVATEDMSATADAEGHTHTTDGYGKEANPNDLDAPAGAPKKVKLSEEAEEVEEEIDLEEILDEMDVQAQGTDPHYYAKVAEQLHTENSDLKRSLREHRNVIKFLKNRIMEINMVNSKLLFANKLFKNFDLNNAQKARVIENLDRASSLREVKLVYATLAEAYTGKTHSPAKRTVKQITEGMASKPAGSTKPKTAQVITEETDIVKQRFQKLAGILKS